MFPTVSRLLGVAKCQNVHGGCNRWVLSGRHITSGTPNCMLPWFSFVRRTKTYKGILHLQRGAKDKGRTKCPVAVISVATEHSRRSTRLQARTEGKGRARLAETDEQRASRLQARMAL